MIVNHTQYFLLFYLSSVTLPLVSSSRDIQLSSEQNINLQNPLLHLGYYVI